MLIKNTKSNFAKLRVLLIQREIPFWGSARAWSYAAHLGLEEGLWANNVELFTLTSPWFSLAQRICSKKKFDQVWINDLVHLDDVDEEFMEWVSGLASVRLGFVIESLKYTPEEYSAFPGLKAREQGIKMRLKYVTHVVTSDEMDADELNGGGKLLAIWAPAAVPKSYFFQRNKWEPNSPAAFCGTLYGDRRDWLNLPALKPLLIHPSSPDDTTPYPLFFDLLSISTRHCFNKTMFSGKCIMPIYLYLLRRIRRRLFIRWLKHFQDFSATINLPTLCKFYPGRVAEAMTVGCPVISWRVPNRPRTEALFIEDKEILFFDKDDPEQLVRQIKRIKTEPGLANHLIEDAQQKMLCLHTVERRIQEILNWIETGKVPRYI